MNKESDREKYLKNYYGDKYEKERLRIIDTDKYLIKFYTRRIKDRENKIKLDKANLSNIKISLKEIL